MKFQSFIKRQILKDKRSENMDNNNFLKVIYFDEAFVADFMQIIAGGELKKSLIELQRTFLKIRFLQILLLCLMPIKEEVRINVVLALKSFPI